MTATSCSSLTAPVNVTASAQAQFVDEAVQGRRVGRHHRTTHHLERRPGVVVGPGHEQRAEGELDRLVRGETADADPAGTGRGGAARAGAPLAAAWSAPWRPAGRRPCGAKPAWRSSASLKADTARPRAARGASPRSWVWARSWCRAMPLSQGA